MDKQEFSLTKRIKSFKHAINGFKILLKEEHNARIHLVAALMVISLSLYLKLDKIEWMFILFSIGIVFIGEILNSAIENLSDFVSPKKNQFIKKAKDLGAAAVLLSAILASIIGLFVFLPKF